MSSSDSRFDSDLDPDYEFALRIALERSKSECEAVEAVVEVDRLAKLEQQQDTKARRLKGLVILSDTSDDDDDDQDSSSDDPPPAANTYNCAGSRKGKGSARKW
ncbi:hypothetical protein D1007_39703 [Hordeum vulgare]|nr:hypothetical protein D1007_39703 [Hordeum vulgare]